jgi:hypothetical protein
LASYEPIPLLVLVRLSARVKEMEKKGGIISGRIPRCPRVSSLRLFLWGTKVLHER